MRIYQMLTALIKEFEKRTNMIKSKLQFPKEEDLSGAAIALIRLQQTYNLNASDLANGRIRKIHIKFIKIYNYGPIIIL